MKQKMPQRLRYKILEICNGKQELLPIIYQMSSYFRFEGCLNWLYENKITGKTLLDWLKIEHDGSIMGMMQFILMKINKNKTIMPILANKDYIIS